MARRLSDWGLGGLAASLLDAVGPLAILGAQALYFAEPVLTPFASEDDVRALARALEDPAAVHALADRLHHESP